MSLETRKFNLLAGITAIAALAMLVGSLIALYMGQITFKEFLNTLSPLVTGLAGYWLRGAKDA